MAKKIVIADRLDVETVLDMKIRWSVADVSERPAELAGELADADVLVVRSMTRVTKELLGKARKLKLVARAGVGLDNIELEECAKRGINVINTPEASTVSVAELAIGLMIALLRGIPRMDAEMKRKKWEKGGVVGRELFGKTVGIVGFGRIGRAVAERLRAFGCGVIAFSPHFEGEGGAEKVSLEELLKRADVVTLHARLDEKTRGMIGREQIAKMKPSAIIINTARGGLVDEDALYEALKNGKIAGAALDVYSEEPYSGKLCGLKNVVLTPHLGGETVEGQARIGKQLVEKLEEIGL